MGTSTLAASRIGTSTLVRLASSLHLAQATISDYLVRSGALGGGLTAALGGLAFSCPAPLCQAAGGCPSPHLLGRSWPDFLAWSVAAAWHIATSSPSGGHRLRSFAGWLLLAQLFYVRRRGAAPLRIPGRQLLACFALRSLAAADVPWPTVGGAPRLGWAGPMSLDLWCAGLA